MAEFPVIPEFITVHLGAPSDNSAENITVSFPDYIKNVASSEIFPTWNEEAIRANIYAQISYALNRVYTEYYRSQGYNFDITNTTALDQSFVRGRNIFENISQIVDEIFDSYIRRQGFVEPLFAQYCNGTTTTCDGLSQWGSESLASEGRSAQEILRNYYGDNIEIVNDVPVQGITASLPSRSLRIGSSGDDVRSIQNRLNRISVNYPAIPKIANVNGFFDLNTENAVREFQRIFNLTPDGIVGKATWYRIQYLYNNIKRLNSLNAEGITAGDISLQFPRVLRPGDTGTGVDVIQYLLNYVAQFENSIAPFEQSGVYDKSTEDAVTAFQKLYGLRVDGIVGEETYSALYDAYRGIIDGLPQDIFIPSISPYPGFELLLGSDDPAVTNLQEYLNFIGNSYTSIPEINVNGVFGTSTRDAVIAFQQEFGLPATGIVGLSTWQAIGDVYEDLISGQTVALDQYPGYEIGGEQNV